MAKNMTRSQQKAMFSKQKNSSQKLKFMKDNFFETQYTFATKYKTPLPDENKLDKLNKSRINEVYDEVVKTKKRFDSMQSLSEDITKYNSKF